MNYDDFIRTKAFVSKPSGLETVPQLNPMLKGHQRLLVSWALRRGRAAIFADTGLGKGWMLLEWCRVLSKGTVPTLILAPLAVAKQFVTEAEKLGVPITLCSSQDDVRPGVNVTNIHKLHKFSPRMFFAVAVDESSIMKHLDGAFRKQLIESFSETPFKLSATATPSPNDHTELGGQAEFLGVMKHQEMLASFFVRDGGSTQDWKLKGHARDVFWKWCASWGAFVRMPSDIGCDDTGYVLPPLKYHEHIIPADHSMALRTGRLFAEVADTLQEQRAARKASLPQRVSKAVEIANACEGQCIVWTDLNAESEACSKSIDGAVEVTGSMIDEEKEDALGRFISGESRVLVSKPSLAGFGLNLQFARTVIFCGVSHSYEQFHQAVRRSWRFGVDGEVNVHIISSELEGAVLANLQRKARDAEQMADETRRYVQKYVVESVTSLARETISYEPRKAFRWSPWLVSEAS